MTIITIRLTFLFLKNALQISSPFLSGILLGCDDLFIQQNFSEVLISTSHYLDSGDSEGRKTKRKQKASTKELTNSSMEFLVRECT